MINFLKALSVFAGTVIGVGIFGLPFVVSKAGFVPVLFYFLIMSAVIIVIHLLFSKISLETKELHRLPGYAGEYLGSRWKKISLLVLGAALTGALLAYLIVGGEFLALLLSPYFGGSSFIYTLLFFAAGSYFIFRGIKSISKIELLLLLVFFSITAIFFIKSYSFIKVTHFSSFDLSFLPLPYGVVLFSLWGLAIVPEIKEMVGGNKGLLTKVIVTGILLAAFTYLFFILAVFGVTGPETSKEAISGLAAVLGDNIVKLGFIFGIITCFTSFLTLGLTLKKVFWYDFNLSPKFSWFLASFIPLFLFLLGLREFIDVIGLTGAVAIGLEGTIIIFLYKEFMKKKFNRKINPLIYSLAAILLLGVATEIFYFAWK